MLMQGLDGIIGQNAVKDLIRAKIQLARGSGIALPHLLLCGDKEQGKMTLVAGMAEELEVSFLSASAETLVSHLDLTGLLAVIGSRQIFAIRDVDALRPPILDDLVGAISIFQLDILVGLERRKHTLPLPRFTFVGTTSKPWLVDERICRWCIPCKFASYTPEEATQIVLRIARDKGVPLDVDAASDIAVQCRLKPGDAKVFLQRVANHFQFSEPDRIDRSKLRQLNDFLGAGALYPDLLAVRDQLQTMDGVEFEHWVAELFRRAGFIVKVTQASGDHGVDLWASIGDRLVAVQCKRWDGSVGEPVMRDLYGAMIAAKAQSGCFLGDHPKPATHDHLKTGQR